MRALNHSAANSCRKSVKLLIDTVGRGDGDGWSVRWFDLGLVDGRSAVYRWEGWNLLSIRACE